MITNLPLLFVNGHPTCLEKMTVQEMERFIPFLVHCSWGRDTVTNIKKPTWWPKDVRFCSPLSRPNIPVSDWTHKLKELIRSCYKYHCSDFLLKFCSDLSRHPASRLLYESNRDGTTSLYLKPTKRLLVTFRDENMLYDKKQALTPRKCLLPRKPESDTPVESEVIEIYLCDTCDNAYESFDELQIHEKRCKPPETPLPPEEPERLSPVVDSRQSFMAALGLSDVSSKPSSISPVKNDFSEERHKLNARDRKTILFNGLSHFPFSSPAGIRTLKLRRKWKEEDLRPREYFERYCSAPPGRADSVRWMTKPVIRHFPVKYKGTSDNWHRTHVFSHQRNKMLLDVDGQLKLLTCKPCSVIINPLTPEQIDSYTKLKTSSSALSNEMSSQDSDIELVSITMLNNQCDTSANKESNSSKTISSNKLSSSGDVIDLCSDDENHNENLHPSPLNCHVNNVNSQIAQSPTVSKNVQPLAVNGLRSNMKNRGSLSKMENISNMQSININEVEKSKLKPLQQCQVLLYKHNNSVISID